MTAPNWWTVPMKYERGTTLPLSVPRQLVCDLLHFAKAVPTVPVQRVVDVGRLAALRARLPQRVGWCAVFTKAFALVGQEVPALRRAYLEYPRPRLYEHPVGVASVAVERDYEGEPGVFFTRIRRPDGLTLPAVEAALRSARERPVEDAFARIIRGYRLPRVVRRAFLWYFLNVCGSRKAQSLGTFGVSTYSALGAESLHPLSPLTTTLNYGVVAPDGTVPVRVVYDHRVMDGSTVARALARLEAVLNGEILREMEALVPTPWAARAVPLAPAG